MPVSVTTLNHRMAALPTKTGTNSAKKTKRPISPREPSQVRAAEARDAGCADTEGKTQDAAPLLTPALDSRQPEQAEHNRARRRPQRTGCDSRSLPVVGCKALLGLCRVVLPQFPIHITRR